MSYEWAINPLVLEDTEILDIAKYISAKARKYEHEQLIKRREMYTSATLTAQMISIVLNNSFSKSKKSFPPYESVFKDDTNSKKRNIITKENAFDYLVHKQELKQKGGNNGR